MCTQQTTEICNQLAAQANVLRVAEQHEATIAAALALPEAERKRLRQLLDEQLRHVDMTEERRIYDRNRRIELLQSRLYERNYHTIGDRDRIKAELEKLKASI